MRDHVQIFAKFDLILVTELSGKKEKSKEEKKETEAERKRREEDNRITEEEKKNDLLKQVSCKTINYINYKNIKLYILHIPSQSFLKLIFI